MGGEPNTYSDDDVDELVALARATEREACAAIADQWADDLVDRMAAPDWKEDVTGEQVVNGYRMISRVIRSRDSK